ncbi:TA system VapC family ribonuclease toxin [Terrabacter sp. 2RAF25]|uniref:TA system VapC family ribonuclease toxin n=1 Tax=Terrabacter sp. 2RAF25 TaxID=3232998 RepID=UPI003F9546A4
MLLLDVNICLYAYRPAESESAALVSEWLAPRLVGHERIGVSEPVLASVIRIATHPRVFRTPSTPSDVLEFAESLASAPAAVRVRPGPEHWPIVTELVREHRLRGNDVPDAVLAAHALELGATLVTLDRGFARFTPLRTVNPLADPG